MPSLLQELRAVLLAYAVGAAVLVSQLLRRLRGGFREPALPPQPGRVAVVTGGADGIGLATARRLARLGMRVVIAGNDEDRARDAVRELRAETGNPEVHFLFLDLASLASVRKFARDFLSLGLPLHVLVLNAGVMLAPRGSRTADGFERHLGVNFLGHFLLTLLLLDALRAAGSRGRRSRVVALGSATHYVGEVDPETMADGHSDPPHAAYARSKLALVLFARRLQRVLTERGDPVMAAVADPGVVDTALFRRAGWAARALQRGPGRLLFKTPDEGAWTPALAAADPALEDHGGRYLRDEAPAEPLGVTGAAGLQDRLWAASARLVGVTGEVAGVAGGGAGL